MEKITLYKIIKELKLKVKTGDVEKSKDIKLKSRGINKGGLELTGYFIKKDEGKFIVFGSKESSYMEKLSQKDLKKVFSNLFNKKIPAFVFTQKIKIPKVVLELAKKKNIYILKSKFSYSDTAFQIVEFLNTNLGKTEQLHGTLMQINGKGILITGNSGVGKSETALELVQKGHFFVVDDGTLIRRSGNQLFGFSPEIIKNLLEVRGIGIIDMNRMFGGSKILDSTKIDYIFNLKVLESKVKFDRLGGELRTKKIMKLDIPVIDIPVSAARNISTLIEVAVTQLILKEKGYDPLHEYKKDMEKK